MKCSATLFVSSLSVEMNNVQLGRQSNFTSHRDEPALPGHVKFSSGTKALERFKFFGGSSANQQRTEKHGKPRRLVAKRSYTTNDQRRHWWKVCWIYNTSLFFQPFNDKYASLQSISGNGSGHSQTLPRNFESPLSKQEGHMWKETQPEKSSDRRSTMVTSSAHPSGGDSSGHNEHQSGALTTVPRHLKLLPTEQQVQLTQSKSMTTLETKTTLLRLSNPLKLTERSFQKEMARFCSQQLYPSHLFQARALWQRSIGKGDYSQSGIVNFLINYKGIDWRTNQLEYQMPIHDLELFRQPTAESKFIRNKQRKALVKSELVLISQPTELCPKCQHQIAVGVHCVKITVSERNFANGNQPESIKNVLSNGPDSNLHTYVDHYHIDCFTCSECHQILVDLKAYVQVNNKKNDPPYNLFCSRHFVEIYKPRCPYCDKLIFDEECTEAEGKAWHIGHFCCTECKRSLGGQQYIMAGSDHKATNSSDANLSQSQSKQLPYCLTCFDILFGELCEECGELIGCEVGAIIHDGRSWHASERCFRCSLCLKSLLGKPFLPALDGRIYCSLTCSQAMMSHQRDRLRRQNKLHTLFSQHKNTRGNQENHQLLNSDKATYELNKTIKENRENFMKSMTLDRYEKQLEACSEQESTDKSALNLSYTTNYEEFIKKNNKCFTSKYDWSKEQEFLDVINSNNDSSSIHSEDNTANSLAKQFNTRLSIKTNDMEPLSSLVDSSRTSKVSSQVVIDSSLSNNSPAISRMSESSQSQKSQDVSIRSGASHVSSHGGDIKLLPPSNFNSINFPIAYAMSTSDQTSSLNSPSLSNEMSSLWVATSPPPEYSKLETEDNSSNSSLIQNLIPQQCNKMNGILKVHTAKSHLDSIKPTFLSNTSDLSPHSSESIEVDRPSVTESSNECSSPFEDISKPQSGPTKSYQDLLKLESQSKISTVVKSNGKSVSFDPTIEEKEAARQRVRRSRSRPLEVHDDCSDSHSCSSCSTCSSSSDDDDDHFDLANFHLTQQMSTYTNALCHKQPTKNTHHNDACTIS